MYNQVLVNGIIAGSSYALIAIGYTMVYGIGRFINFAHGEMYMMGAFLFYSFRFLLGLEPVISAFLSIVLVAFAGVLLEKVAYKYFRDKSKFIPLINTVGASIFLQSIFSIIFGVNDKSLSNTKQFSSGLELFGILITPIQLLIVFSTIVLTSILFFLLKKTRLGKAIRATSEDREIASVLGININLTISATFAIGSGLAAIAGILVGHDQNISPTMGCMVGIKAFTAAVLGGIGNITGAVLGGLGIGLIESYTGFFISSGYKEGIIFLILLLLLLFRPHGILGKFEGK